VLVGWNALSDCTGPCHADHCAEVDTYPLGSVCAPGTAFGGLTSDTALGALTLDNVAGSVVANVAGGLGLAAKAFI
jgi:hypothetical protein